MSLWDYGVEVKDYLRIPPWVEDNITVYDIAAIVQGGCASGAYMPAVTYYAAAQTMSRHGDAVVDFIECQGLDVPSFDTANDSWDGYACSVLSFAVELWACGIEEELIELLEDEEDE